ncbi:MAG TPA: 6-pyruvoyl tetrahydropterin synthase family protein [Ktedonobacteraceae bacterium]|nr:6-pyruvoyl tetrahydropterin synthase family protein [Ktedonobacteraceae bacterium]
MLHTHFSLQNAATEGKITAWQSGLYGTLLQHWRGIRIGRLLDKEWESPGMAGEQILRRVKVEGGYLRFSSAHFITFGGKCERLHGHNYGVLVEAEGTLNEDKLVFDFTVLKRLTREICRTLNHRFLLPLHNPHLQLIESPDAWEIHFEAKRYVFPRSDVVELPIDNSSAERLAEYICGELYRMLAAEYDISNLDTLMVGVEEAPTQMAYYRRPLRQETSS